MSPVLEPVGRVYHERRRLRSVVIIGSVPTPWLLLSSHLPSKRSRLRPLIVVKRTDWYIVAHHIRRMRVAASKLQFGEWRMHRSHRFSYTRSYSGPGLKKPGLRCDYLYSRSMAGVSFRNKELSTVNSASCRPPPSLKCDREGSRFQEGLAHVTQGPFCFTRTGIAIAKKSPQKNYASFALATCQRCFVRQIPLLPRRAISP